MATVNGENGDWMLDSTGGTINITATGYDPNADTNFTVYAVAVAKDVNGVPTDGLYDGDNPDVTWNTSTGVVTVVLANATQADWLVVVYFSYCDGGVCSGDPHVTTFDGDSFTL